MKTKTLATTAVTAGLALTVLVAPTASALDETTSTPAPATATSTSTTITSSPTTSSSTATTTTSPSPSVFYANCAAVRAAGKAPLLKGQSGYRRELDRDGDGIACETGTTATTSKPSVTTKTSTATRTSTATKPSTATRTLTKATTVRGTPIVITRLALIPAGNYSQVGEDAVPVGSVATGR